MSLKIRKSELERKAKLFSALGDKTRLKLVAEMIDGEKHSIAELTKKTDITRQGITKHLFQLENVGLVKSETKGRKTLYNLKVNPFIEIKEMIEFIEVQWDQSLNRLKTYLEKE